MPAARLSRRRKSSHALFTPAKAGIYGIPARPVTFAPNVTPITYVDTEDSAADFALDGDASGSPTATLFPPSATPAPPPARKRCPPGKRRSQGYIPRPPNAFMLFRADFVRQKHVPGSIETNHGSLSKIIGTCWRQLPLEEKRVWEVRAKHEKAAHKAQFPDYRFRPVHNKNKNLASSNANFNSSNTHSSNTHQNHNGADIAESRRKEKQPATLEDERRCDEVAQLLLEGKKGEELAAAVRHLDRARERELAEMAAAASSHASAHSNSASPAPHSHSLSHSHHTHGFAQPHVQQHQALPHLHMPLPVPGASPGFLGAHSHSMGMGMCARRPSSVPLPGDFYGYTAATGIAMPTLPFLASRGASPVASISRQGQHAFATGGRASFSQQGFHYPFGAAQEFGYGGDFGAWRASFAFGSGSTTANNTTDDNTNGTANDNNAHAHTVFPPPAFSPFGQGFGHPTLAQRNSLGLGLGRRASSAQPMMMRSSWGDAAADDVFAQHQHDMFGPMFGGYGAAYGAAPHFAADGGAVERDESPLPDVEPELFAADFSFGASSASASAASASAGNHHASACHASGASVSHAAADAVSPVSPVDVPPTQAPSAGSSVYEGSPHSHVHTLSQHGNHSHHASVDGMYAPHSQAQAQGGMWRADMMAQSQDGGLLSHDGMMSQDPTAGALMDGKALGLDLGLELGLGMEMGMEMNMGMDGMGYYAGSY